MADASPMPDPDGPPLRTFVWFRRIALASAVACVGLLALRQATLRAADARWRTMQQTLVAAGVPERIEDWQPPPIADEANPAAFYQRAFARLPTNVDSPSQSVHDSAELGASPPYLPLWHQLVDAAESAGADALAIARQARAADPADADWGTIYKSPAVSVLLPNLNQARNLANLLADCGERSILHGDATEGVERFRDVLHLARSVQVRRPVLVETLVAAGVAALACHRVGAHALALPIGDARGQVTPAQARALIADLLATADAMSTGVAYTSEAAVTGDTIGHVGAEAWVTRGVLLLERQRISADWFAAAAVARRTDHAGRNALPVVPATGKPTPNFDETMRTVRMSRPLRESVYAASPQRALVTEARVVTMLRAAAVVVAARLHAHEHGRPPTSFEDLIPGFLPRRPDNPLSGDGTPFRIRVVPAGLPGGSDRVLLEVLATEAIPAGVGRVDWPVTSVDLAPWSTTAPAPKAP